ncbi:DUF7220 family protein [Mameliella alba]|uniref:DUF7220 family protein n=1 Tax=Mameliella alba TaxID=561184 RepID=UPI000B533288|nr:hypothetical protein [Mameliella alba]MBY6122046.1 hypothetical protein [Mameliella alba]OWV40067.1 hypothetical protein CDZ95_23605 [Mameliella alba]OWV58442.1 hypothetical protein CDZ97_21285 [Mameliella alba]
MSQPRVKSAMGAVANVVVGWCTAFITQLAVFPAVGVQAGLGQHVAISLFFTAVSLVRSYVLRRLFARLT